MLANPRTALFWEGSDHSDGSFQERPAGTVDYHGVHGHYHYSSFANALLWRSDSRGERIGNAPVAASHKVSFRMADIRIEAWGEKRVQVLGVLKK